MGDGVSTNQLISALVYGPSIAMSAQLDPGVEQRLDAPSNDKEVTLIVGVEDSESGTILDQIRGSGATIEDHLPCNYLALSISESDLDSLCELESVTSIEIEGVGETLESGDF